jgi:hypothetical protein
MFSNFYLIFRDLETEEKTITKQTMRILKEILITNLLFFIFVNLITMIYSSNHNLKSSLFSLQT